MMPALKARRCSSRKNTLLGVLPGLIQFFNTVCVWCEKPWAQGYKQTKTSRGTGADLPIQYINISVDEWSDKPLVPAFFIIMASGQAKNRLDDFTLLQPWSCHAELVLENCGWFGILSCTWKHHVGIHRISSFHVFPSVCVCVWVCVWGKKAE